MNTNKSNIHLFGCPIVCRRTSAWDRKPCDEAEKVKFVSVDRRTIDDPMKNRYIGAKWYDEGRNHRVEYGRIARDFDDMRWVVTFADAAALEAFCLKYGDVVLSVDNTGLSPCFSIEIYDSYRE